MNKSLYKTLRSNSVEAELNFPNPKEIASYNKSSSHNKHIVTITNARTFKQAPSLTKEGFCLIQHSELLSYGRGDVNLNLLIQLFQSYLESHIRVNLCICLGATIRSSEVKDAPTSIKTNVYRPPARLVHADWGSNRLQQFLNNKSDFLVNRRNIDIDEIIKALDNGKHCSIYNVWLPLVPIINLPLALCAQNSVTESDFLDVSFEGVRAEGQASLCQLVTLQPHPKHQWFYYPLMQCDEFLIFHQLSSDINRINPVFHSAFDLISPDALGSYVRRSVEFRFLVLK